MSGSDVLNMIAFTVGGIIFIFVLIYVLSKVSLNHAIKKNQKMNNLSSLLEGYSQMEDKAHIVAIRHTSMMMNQYPVMEVRFTIFPKDGPMINVDISRAFTYAEIPYLKANTTVRVSYQYNEKTVQTGAMSGSAVQNIRILGPAMVEWEGDHSVKDAASSLITRLEGSKLIETQGEIMSIEKTDAILDGYPVFRYHVRFQTKDGYNVEGDTYQAARPWLEEQRFTGCTEIIQYSATNHNDFMLVMR